MAKARIGESQKRHRADKHKEGNFNYTTRNYSYYSSGQVTLTSARIRTDRDPLLLLADTGTTTLENDQPMASHLFGGAHARGLGNPPHPVRVPRKPPNAGLWRHTTETTAGLCVMATHGKQFQSTLMRERTDPVYSHRGQTAAEKMEEPWPHEQHE